jgi:hypothetical protein
VRGKDGAQGHMNTAPQYRSCCACVAPLHSKMRNGMEDVVGSIPTRSTISHSGGFFLSWCFRFRMPALGRGVLDFSVDFPAQQESKAGHVEPHHQDHDRAQ